MQKAIKALITISSLSLLLLVLYRPAATASAWIGLTQAWLQHKVVVTTDRPLHGIKTNDKIVALTFDDGPNLLYTPAILNILKENSVQATFFVVGKNAKEHPEIIMRTQREGHEIGNHTYSHPEMQEISPEALIAEIKKADAELQKITGLNTLYFRAPKGVINSNQLKILNAHGYQTVAWNICIENKTTKTPDEMVARVLNNIQPGNVILLHDGRLNRSTTVGALDILIKELKKEGYNFTTLSGLYQGKY